MNNSTKAVRPILYKDDELIKNPFSLVETLGQFSVTQMNILMTLIASIQDRINTVSQDLVGHPRQLSLFADEEFTENKIQFQLPLRSLDIIPAEYPMLEKACQALSSVLVPVERIDVNGNKLIGPMQMIRCFMPESSVTKKGEAMGFAHGTRRTGYLIIEIEKAVSDKYFHNNFGYVTQLYKLSRKCKCSKTFPLYSILSRYRSPKMGNGIYEEQYEKLKELLGVLKYKPGTTIIEVDTYTKWKDFKRRVLEPAYEELKRLFMEDTCNFYFEYTLIYEDGKTRGNPSKIRFSIIDSKPAVYDQIETINVPPKRTYITGSSRGDYNLLKKLAASGSEWAKQALADAASGKEWDEDTFKEELDRYALI